MKDNQLPNVHAILIAAGASKRLGQAKQLVNYHGRPLIVHTLNQLQQSDCNKVQVVLGANREIISSVIPDADIIYNPNWELGMGTSITRGLRHIEDEVSGVLICLVDQYHLTTALINSIIAQHIKTPDKIIACQYGNDIIGPPAIFSSKYLKDLRLLSGDSGAGKLIKKTRQQTPDQIQVIPFPNGHLDIDFPADLKNLES